MLSPDLDFQAVFSVKTCKTRCDAWTSGPLAVSAHDHADRTTDFRLYAGIEKNRTLSMSRDKVIFFHFSHADRIGFGDTKL